MKGVEIYRYTGEAGDFSEFSYRSRRMYSQTDGWYVADAPALRIRYLAREEVAVEPRRKEKPRVVAERDVCDVTVVDVVKALAPVPAKLCEVVALHGVDVNEAVLKAEHRESTILAA